MDAPRHLLVLLPVVTVLIACGAPDRAVRIEPVAPPASPAPAARAAPPSVPVPASTPIVPIPPSPAPATGDPIDARLLAAIVETLGADVEDYGVVVRRLHDGHGAAVNADQEFYAASLFKLALLYEAERQRTLGLLDFDETLQILDEDVAEDLGTFGSLELDESGMIPVRAAVQAMVTRSDNTSAVLLLRTLGAAMVDRSLAELGLRHTSVNTRDLPTTAADMAMLMEAIVRGQGVDRAWREDMIGLLLRQETRSGVPALLPPHVRTGNKTGTWPGATHDVAFVDAPGGVYVIAILSNRGWDWDPIARVSRAVYDVLN